MTPELLPEPIKVAVSLGSLFEHLGVRYLVGGSFNLIHLEVALKVDIFVAGSDPFDAARFHVRQELSVSEEPPAKLFIDTAENSVLRKLEWYRRGGEVSDRQWRDVVAILSLRRGSLNRTWMDQWAPVLGVVDLLERAIGEIE